MVHPLVKLVFLSSWLLYNEFPHFELKFMDPGFESIDTALVHIGHQN